MGELGPWKRDEGLDHWERRGKNDFRSCSFCGSLHPDEFMAGIESGAYVIGVADKSYKAYVDRPYTAEELAANKARWLASDLTAAAVRGSLEARGASPDEVAEALDVEYAKIWGALTSTHVTKFYFMHLDEAQMRKFVDLYNERKIGFGYPGGFTVLPYFMGRAA